MKILLLGEYSNVHWTLAEGLRTLGHDVTVISNGDGWKNYKRDINLKRKSLGLFDSIKYYIDILKTKHKMKGYDIVQIINPIFFDLRACRMRKFYDFLRKNNKKIVLGAFGMDYYWVSTCIDCKTFRYSDFNIGNRLRIDEPCNKPFVDEWLANEKADLNKYIANDCDAIVSGLYEYDCCYRPHYPNKTTYIPFPIKLSEDKSTRMSLESINKVRFFVGIQKSRNEYKGTDIMLRALERVYKQYPDQCEIIKAENVPFEEYSKMILSSDVLLDQLYSYTPAMNALLAMSKGLVAVSGGEPENYTILNETELRPIINVLPDEDDCFNKMEWLVLNKSQLPKLKSDSIEYIKRHHDYIKVAKRYSDLYSQLLS